MSTTIKMWLSDNYYGGYMIFKYRNLTLIFLMFILSACTTIAPRTEFQEVSNEISERIGKQIYWKNNTQEDDEVAKQVRDILAQQISVEQAVQIALLTNPKIQAIYEELGIAQADLVQAGLLNNPIFSASVLYPSGGGSSNLDFDISWNFLSLFTMPLNKALAKTEANIAFNKVVAAVLDLSDNVRSAFYRAQANSQAAEMLQQVVMSTDASYEAAKRLHHAGNITDLALDQQRLLYEEAKLLLIDSEFSINQSREQLNKLMGLWGNAIQWEISLRLPDMDEETFGILNIEQRVIDKSIDLELYRLQITKIAQQLGLVDITSLIPDIDIGFGWERDDGEYQRGPSIGIQVPIFDTGQARKASLQGRLNQAQREYISTAIALRSSARLTAQTLLHHYARVNHFKQTLMPLRQQIVNGAQLEYNAMQIGVFKLLSAQKQQIDTGRQYISSLRDYWLARVKMDILLSGRMSSSSELNVSMTSATTSNENGEH
jgi:cobalt-zinc-cadmium efflux system outer membrane protein